MSKSVAIYLPLYKASFSEDEIFSLRVLRKKLAKKYQVFMSVSEDLVPFAKSHPLLKGYKMRVFPKKFFTLKGYCELLESEEFYRWFIDFDYMLIYQPDCLAFSDSLDYWMDKNYDYVGSPWVELKKNEELKLTGVGNGGLSLRKIKTFMEVTRLSKKFFVKAKLLLRNLIPSIYVLFYKLLIDRDCPKYHVLVINEDIFFSYAAKQILPDFKIASKEDALKFSFEKYPSLCYKKNNNNLPFGCHAYQKYDKNFWMSKMKKSE